MALAKEQTGIATRSAFGSLLLVSFLAQLSLLKAEAKAAPTVAKAPQSAASESRDLRSIFDEAHRERNAYHIEKSRKLFEEIARLGGTTYYGEHAQIILRTEFPKYPVSAACENLYRKADSALKNTDFRDALTYYTELIRLFPKFELGYAGLSDIYMHMEDTEKAAQAARSILAINENFVQAWYILSHDAMAHQDLKGALDSATRAHELDPYNITISNLLNRLKDQAKAEEPD